MSIFKKQLCLGFLLLTFTLSAQEMFKTVTAVDFNLRGIGLEKDVMRRDPSDIIKVGDVYYVWYSKGCISTSQLTKKMSLDWKRCAEVGKIG